MAIVQSLQSICNMHVSELDAMPLLIVEGNKICNIIDSDRI